MPFTNRLPKGAAQNWRYPIEAPEGGLGRLIDAFRYGETVFLDLPVRRDFTRLLVRVALQPHQLIEESLTVFRFESAPAILLNEDGKPTGDTVVVTGSLNKEVVSAGLPAGILTMWTREKPDSKAS